MYFNQKLISVIVPTKNRYDQLYVLLTHIYNLPDIELVEVIIQDNSDESLFKCDKFYSHGFKYNYVKNSIPISDNIELAFTHCTGKYLLIIGDDDFLIYDFVSNLLELDRLSPNVITYSGAHYYWPNVRSMECKLVYSDYTKEIRELNPKQELINFANSGATEMRSLPKGYHGVVKRELYLEIIKKYGSVIHGSSPDISIAVALTTVATKHIYYDYPLTIYGASPKSTAALTVKKEHHGRPDKIPFLRPSTLTNWDHKLPFFWSERIIYAQSFYEVAKKMNIQVSTKYCSFWTSLIVLEFHVFNTVKQLDNSLRFKLFSTILSCPLFFFKRLLGRSLSSLNVKKQSKFLILVENPEEVSLELQKRINKQ